MSPGGHDQYPMCPDTSLAGGGRQLAVGWITGQDALGEQHAGWGVFTVFVE